MTITRSGLDAILPRDLAAVREWESREFDRLSGGRPIVLMGAGGLGRRALGGLRQHGVEPLAFVDNNRHGTTLDGIPVLSPQQAAAEHGAQAAFVVTIWGANSPHRFEHSRAQMQALGCDVVLPFPPLFWKYPGALLPFYLQDLPSRLIEQRAAVLNGFDVWQDDESRAEYVAQVRLRLHADFESLSHPISHAQYFPDDLFAWSDDEWIVDGGAYDGDTVRALSTLRGNRFAHLLALEPDPANFARLLATVNALPAVVANRVDCRQVAVGSCRGVLHLDATGTAGSATTRSAAPGRIAVDAETIDEMVGASKATFIKLDIEGFEIDALRGARQTIERDMPVLAVCVYHLQDHLWRIPLLLRDWLPTYAFFLRPHNEEGWDLVCYGIPRARLTGTSS